MKTKGKIFGICCAAITALILTGALVQFFMPETVETLVSGIEILKRGSSSTDTYGTWDYIINDDNTIEIIGYTEKSGVTEIVIPSTIEGKTVITIGTGALRDCTTLTKITIPNTITGIGPNAFYGCSNLESVVIGNNVKSIQTRAFAKCTSLTRIETPSSVVRIDEEAFLDCTELEAVVINGNASLGTNIGAHAFKGCTKLSNLTIDEEVIYIGTSAFSGCIGLNNVNIPNTVITIGAGAFSDCTELATVTLESGIEGIGANAFSGCTKLTTITIPSTVKNVGANAFINCTELSLVTLKEGITSIGKSAFEGCTKLTEIKTPSTITKINERTFYGCTALETATLIKGITSIGKEAFEGCTSLTGIEIPYTVATIGDKAFYGCTSLEEVVTSNGTSEIGASAFEGCSELKSLTLDTNITKIGEKAFADCSKLSNVEIPTGITEISIGTFKNCTSLTEIIIKNNVRNIKKEAFMGCTNIQYVDISKNTMEIGIKAFMNCSSITMIEIPSSVHSIGDLAFEGTSKLQAIDVSINNERYSSVDGVLYNYDKTTLIKVPENSATGTFKVPNTVTTIYQYAFSGYSGLTGVTIPESVTSIGNYAFNKCTGLKQIVIPTTVETVGEHVFADCDEITITSKIYDDMYNLLTDCTNYSIVIHSGVTSIPQAAFAECSELKSISIPNTVTSIESSAFRNCTKLENIEIPESVTNIGNQAFKQCTSLREITIPDSVEVIPSDVFNGCSEELKIKYNGFVYDNTGSLLTGITFNKYTRTIEKCHTSLADIKIPAMIDGYVVNNIGEGAFSDCTYLESIQFPSTLKSIKEYAFSGCIRLLEIDIPVGVTTIGANAFDGCVSLTDASIPVGVKKIADNLFNGCVKLTRVSLPEGITAIGTSAFDSCKSLTQIELPESTTKIETGAFTDCGSLKRIDIPDNVTSIADDAFDGCNALTIYASVNSYAIEYAKAKGIAWEIVVPDIESDASYKLEHYTENLDGTFTLADTENLTAMPNTTVTATAKQYDGFTFDNTVEGTVVSGTVAEDGSLVLKLYYKRNTYTLAYNSNGGTGTMESQVFKDGEEKNLNKNVFTREGHIFIGWNVKEDGTGTSFGDESKIALVGYANNDTVNLYAQWKAIPTGLTATYGETLADVELPEGFSFEQDLSTKVGNVGTSTFTVKYTPNEGENYNEVTAIEVTIEVGKATYDMSSVKFEDKTFVYDGTEKRIEITGELLEGVTVSYENNTGTEIGTYNAVAKFIGDSVNYNEIPSMTAILTISAEAGSISNIQDLSKVYDGVAVTDPSFTKVGDGAVRIEWYKLESTVPEIIAEAPVNAGTYKVKIIMEATHNFTGAQAEKTFTISKATYDMSNISFTDATYTYDGTEKSVAISGELPEGVTVRYENNTGTNAGEYNSIAIFTGDSVNYNTIENKTAKLVIAKANPTYTVPENLTAEEGQTLANISLPAGFMWEQALTTNVGEVGTNVFTLKYTPEDTQNYEILTGIEVNVTVIEKAEISTGDYETTKAEDGKEYIEKISFNTTIENIKKQISEANNSNVEVKVLNKNGEEITKESKLATGMKIQISKGQTKKEYEVVVEGDIVGDGKLDGKDLLRMARYKAGLDTTLNGAYLRATNVFRDNKFADNKDLLKLARIMAGLENL